MSWNKESNLRKHKYLKPLIKEIEKNGYKVEFLSSSSAIGIKNAYGVCNETDKRVGVVRQDAQGKMMTLEDMAFVLAHELRHVQHRKLGMFNSYYTKREKGTVINVGVGYRAELDCDKFAREYVRANCSKPSRLSFRRYSKKKVVGYAYYQILKTTKSVYLAKNYGLYGEAGLRYAILKNRREKWGEYEKEKKLEEELLRSKKSKAGKSSSLQKSEATSMALTIADQIGIMLESSYQDRKRS